MQTLTNLELRAARTRYFQQKHKAIGRGILFQLTFEEWMQWWMETGHWHERGRKRGEYVMSRFDDIGPYALDNIECITRTDNSLQAHTGAKRPLLTRQRISKGVAAARAKEKAPQEAP